jgi:uncharacterized protein (DUF302 family)
MNGKVLFGVLAGLLLGVVATLGALYSAAPSLLFIEHDSKLGYEETLAAIHEATAEAGWIIPKQYKLDASLAKAGYEVLPVTVIELCNPDHAYSILAEDEYRLVSSMMPCRVAVYETSDGRTTISRMNTGLMSRILDPTARAVMLQATRDTDGILSALEQ